MSRWLLRSKPTFLFGFLLFFFLGLWPGSSGTSFRGGVSQSPFPFFWGHRFFFHGRCPKMFPSRGILTGRRECNAPGAAFIIGPPVVSSGLSLQSHSFSFPYILGLSLFFFFRCPLFFSFFSSFLFFSFLFFLFIPSFFFFIFVRLFLTGEYWNGRHTGTLRWTSRCVTYFTSLPRRPLPSRNLGFWADHSGRLGPTLSHFHFRPAVCRCHSAFFIVTSAGSTSIFMLFEHFFSLPFFCALEVLIAALGLAFSLRHLATAFLCAFCSNPLVF